jgi:hypothetical protein
MPQVIGVAAVTGAVLTLGVVVARANRLHTARFSEGQVGAVRSSRYGIPNSKAPH